MYKVNLYREYFERRSQARWQRIWIAAFTGLVGIEALLVVFLALGAILLGEQVRALRGEVSRQEALVAAESQPPPDFALAEKVLALRQRRLEWYPVLSAVSCRIEPSLILLDLTGQTAETGRQPRLELNGLVRGDGPQVDPLSRFTAALRNDPAIVEEFPEVTLDIVEGGGSGRFRVVCQAPRTEP